MKITNDFFKKTNYRNLKNCILSEKQLEFVNRLNFNKYETGWDFMGELSFCHGNFNGAVEQCLFSFSKNIGDYVNFVDLIVKFDFLTDHNKSIMKELERKPSELHAMDRYKETAKIPLKPLTDTEIVLSVFIRKLIGAIVALVLIVGIFYLFS